MNILILTGKFGMGHWSAALSLKQQLLSSRPDASVDVVDFPAYALPNLSGVMYKAFNLMVSHGRHLFNMYYRATGKGHPDARPLFEGIFLKRLAELLCQEHPDVVIATHPLCAQLVSRFKERIGGCLVEEAGDGNLLDLPLITCVTDVSSHPEWINRNTDCYLVPNGEIRRSLAEKGVDPDLVCVTGIPVREEFRHLTHCSTSGGRELLIMGGGLGLLPRDTAFYDALSRIPNTHVTIITGRNRRLYERLHGRWANIQVEGYISRVWDYMARADLIVSKPGGITLFEAIFAGVPILAWPPALENEHNNARWMVRKGIGWVAEEENCAGQIQELLLDPKRLSDAVLCMECLRMRLQAGILNRLMDVVVREGEATV
ncbi:MAG: UDP-diphospho-muramoylpentapeptide beta-N-acetylglucosaminyltransferase [Acetatifactor sp.]|nr:UDP-diphospho-muramoylpentapeptide beta-N-acetylglucosaminyltransferase [Acetatifactor sp.]